ncbi:uncharacterized protein TM35_001201010 [Trypanosoma theileri]|uniref:Transglutaminase n=1 Tax=Trypanosoma theileri TaxID=67003 RepID=A0A1X0NDM4_9TRYP|nr:uncharacterized protein TM35_001201010 [Trypanosoma theileri]ORC81339.1 hypothetical protein TM35_001201010 [Trypanosoma theileri]
MTTMFIQLRRVVYLLVLLQCYACMASATNEDNGEEAPEHTETPEEKERKYNDKVVRLRNVSGMAHARYVEGRSCLNVWRDTVRASNESYARARSAAEVTDGIAVKIGLMKDKMSKSPGTFAEWDSVSNLLDEVKKTTSNIEEMIKETEKKIPSIKKVGDLCKTEHGNAVDILKELEKAHFRYEEVFDTTEEVKWKKEGKLLENSTETQKLVEKFIKEFELFRGEAQVSRVNALIQIVKAKDSIKGTAAKFNELEVVVEEEAKKAGETGNAKKVNSTLHEVKNTVEGAQNIKEPEKNTLLTTSEFNVTLRKERVKVAQEVAQEILRAQREKEERARRAAEEAQREKERVQKEREDRERKAAEEAQREKERVQKEREDRERKAAEEAQREKERVQKEREDRERKAAEEAQREKERVQKEREERERKVAEEAQREKGKEPKKATKGGDNSNGPGLVHSHLLLVLLCVLGCTLVY